MDSQRKCAYRYLLYSAMLRIRGVQWLDERFRKSWNPLRWRRASREVEYAGALADWLHNLAIFSAHDFQGFDEEWFWSHFEDVRTRFPEFNPENFQHEFKRQTNPSTAERPDDKPK